ncbi:MULTISPECIES: DUF1566 domain-containing protein [unclassified Vibrio]|uniref:Lcl C-terminal domain-containing protein n=1 Tax=unclassified Vibrio TaxID=2614977 RepID=UPI001A8D8809|nr:MULTISPECIES: DUF1566 domain-containing protein [unclassified Vibrio]MBO0208650.1 DUF1566 domain-containing protein [Vibrio sp. Vb0877]MDW2322696.1 DUF1566 domain-containing protein [Vibrio sp. 1159]
MSLTKNLVTIAILASLNMISGCAEESDDDSSSSTSTEESVTAPTFTMVQEVSFNEPENGLQTFDVTVSLSRRASVDITLHYDISSITATSGTDFEAQSGVVTIPAGVTRIDIPVTLIGDQLDEDDELLEVTISDPSFGEVSRSAGSTEVTIRDSDDETQVSFASSLVTVSEASGDYDLVINLSVPTEKNVQIPFQVTGLAKEGSDFLINTPSPINVPSGADQVVISLSVINDSLPEGGESIVFDLETPNNAALGETTETIVMIPGDLGLNDSGSVSWYDGSTYTSTSPNSTYPGQDAEFGLDVTNQSVDFDGPAGFSFTKLDHAGNALPSNADNFTCVRDNRTGLVWETKQPEMVLPTNTGTALSDELDSYDDENPYPYTNANSYWRATNYQYYWYNSDSTTNGGAVGARGDRLDRQYQVSNLCAYQKEGQVGYDSSSKYCDTDSYVTVVNDLSLCGYKDWRLPEVGELESIYNYRATVADETEVEYFDDNMNGDYISSTPFSNGTGSAWCINQGTGQIKLCNKQSAHYIRLVRGDAQ